MGNDPRAIFEHVRNNFEYEPYYIGAVKGTQETLDAKAGNDLDLASLLVALLRAGGTPARYTQRQIKVPADTAASWIGVNDPITAARVLASGGLAVTVVLRSGQPVALMFDHIWVEAYVTDGGGKAWKALDPSYKLHTIRAGRNVSAEAGMTGQGLVDALRAAADATSASGELRTIDLEQVQTVLTQRRDTTTAYLAANAPTLTLNQVIGGRSIIQESITQLPTRPPYGGRGSTSRFDQVADSAKQKIRFRVYGIDTTLNIADIADRKVTLGFAPATSADQTAIDAAGGLLGVAPGSVNLRPQLKLDGVVVAQGIGAPVGYYLNFGLDFSQGTRFLGQSLHAVSIGGTYSVALDAQSVPVARIQRSRARLAAALAASRPVLSDDVLGEMLTALGLGYFRYNDLTTEYLAGTQNAVAFQQVSEALIGQDLLPDYSVAPARMALGGFTIDVKRNVLSLLDRSGSQTFSTFPLLYTIGSASSSLEHLFLDLMARSPGISTMELLGTAADNELPIQGIGPENAATVVPTLTVPQSTKDRITQVVAQGYRVIIPRSSQQVANWRGAAWVEFDPQTGASAFLLQGGVGGGSTILSWFGLSPTQQQDL